MTLSSALASVTKDNLPSLASDGSLCYKNNDKVGAYF